MKRNSKIAGYILIALVIIILIASFVRCRPTKSLTDTTKERKDSIVYRVRIDTLRQTDSVKTIIERTGFNQRELMELMKLMRSGKDTTIYLTGTNGKTEIHLADGRGYLKTENTDHVSKTYQRSLDSLQSQLKDLKEHNRETVKGMGFFDYLKLFAICIFVALVVLGIAAFVIWKKVISKRF